MFEFTVKIPDEVVESGMFEDAAAAVGWTDYVDDGNGGTMENPVSAIAYCLYKIAIPTIQSKAMDGRIARQTAEIRTSAMIDIDNAGATWQAALQQEG